MKLLVINGPNLNLLGLREPDIYGRQTYADLVRLIEETCAQEGIEVECFQSNHEGAIVDKIQAAYGLFDGVALQFCVREELFIALAELVAALDLVVAHDL